MTKRLFPDRESSRRPAWRGLAGIVTAGVLFAGTLVRAQEVAGAAPWWSARAGQAVERAGANGKELARALSEVPAAQRESMEFLVENMPARDLQALGADFLLLNVAQATEAWQSAPWAQTVPKEVFLNAVLPYVNASETRDSWRADLRARCLPLVEGCPNSGQAALKLNESLFPLLKVKYSTGRARADQCPAESMASGLASCTGLTILLVDACRSVGVPARLVGIPDWVDGRGNHTWVEVWDGGKWHFMGAAEPDKLGLDHAWFERDAALAQTDSPRHAIYAVSFRRTGLPFPLAWGPDSGDISAENVTEHYTGGAKPADHDAAAAKATRVMVRVRDGRDGPRVPAAVSLKGVADPALEKWGTSKDESADTNDMLAFDLPHGQSFDLNADAGGKRVQQRFTVGTDAQQVVEVALLATDAAAGAEPGKAETDGPQASESKPTGAKGLDAALAAFFTATPEQQATWKFAPALETALNHDPAAVRHLAWEAYRRAPIHTDALADFAANRVRSAGYESPYTLRKVGEKPPGGWGVVIAMHGGGGAPKELNDSQWQGMQTYYNDQPGPGYLYVALRAPNDTWNGFYDDYVYPLIDRLIRQLALGDEVDPDRVYLIGYSHGGYGAFAIGPKIPDHFAAIHSSAAAQTDGLVSPKTLRNTAFDFAVGEFDDAYDRRKRCEAFMQSVQELRGSRTDVFPVTFKTYPGRHHSDLPDHDQLREMLPHRRDPVPRELTWEETDGMVKNFFWLEDLQPVKGREIDATCRDNRLTVSVRSGGASRFAVRLDERLIDFRRPVVVEHDGQQESIVVKPSLRALCDSMLERGDAGLAFSARLEFEVDAEGKLRVPASGPEARP